MHDSYRVPESKCSHIRQISTTHVAYVCCVTLLAIRKSAETYLKLYCLLYNNGCCYDYAISFSHLYHLYLYSQCNVVVLIVGLVLI